jgi:hypothetical protein
MMPESRAAFVSFLAAVELPRGGAEDPALDVSPEELATVLVRLSWRRVVHDLLHGPACGRWARGA